LLNNKTFFCGSQAHDTDKKDGILYGSWLGVWQADCVATCDLGGCHLRACEKLGKLRTKSERWVYDGFSCNELLQKKLSQTENRQFFGRGDF